MSDTAPGSHLLNLPTLPLLDDAKVSLGSPSDSSHSRSLSHPAKPRQTAPAMDDDDVAVLIELRADPNRIRDFHTDDTHKHTAHQWTNITARLNELRRTSYSVKIVRQKFNNLRTRFKKITKRQQSSGALTKWPHFVSMQRIVESEPAYRVKKDDADGLLVSEYADDTNNDADDGDDDDGDVDEDADGDMDVENDVDAAHAARDAQRNHIPTLNGDDSAQTSHKRRRFESETANAIAALNETIRAGFARMEKVHSETMNMIINTVHEQRSMILTAINGKRHAHSMTHAQAQLAHRIDAGDFAFALENDTRNTNEHADAHNIVLAHNQDANIGAERIHDDRSGKRMKQ